MKPKSQLVGIALAAIVGGATLAGPGHGDAAGWAPSSWFKPPMPCVVVRAKVKAPSRTGWCPSRAARLEDIRLVLATSASGIDPMILTMDLLDLVDDSRD
jgi:hypothetical protein